MIYRVVTILWREIRADRSARVRLAATLLLVGLAALTSLLTPYMFKRALDALDPRSDATRAGWILASYIAAFLVMRLCSMSRWLAYAPLEQRIYRLLHLHLFSHIHRLPAAYHTGKSMGGLQQTISDGVSGFRTYLYHILFVCIPFFLQISTSTVVLATSFQPVFALVTLSVTATYLALMVVCGRLSRRSNRDAHNAWLASVRRLSDSFLNYQPIRQFGAADAIRWELDLELMRGEVAWRRFCLIRFITSACQALCMTLALTITTYLAFRGIASHQMSIGDFALVTTYLLQLIQPIEEFGAAFREVQVARASVERLLQLIDQPHEQADSPTARELLPIAATINFSGVSFGYDHRDEVLRRVCFSVPAGHMLGIAGPSGAGKSTIVHLLLRDYEPDTGLITIDGVPIAELSRASLRAGLSCVTQDPTLFNQTIAYNIGIGREGASQQDVVDAAQAADLHEFILSLPDGYETLVGERGLKLSGGERQRLGIARALLKDTGILILDEATSSLDSATERRVLKSLRDRAAGITILMIAHRLSTIADADRIIVLDAGRVVECGTHAELLTRGGLYEALWARQRQDCSSHDAGKDRYEDGTCQIVGRHSQDQSTAN